MKAVISIISLMLMVSCRQQVVLGDAVAREGEAMKHKIEKTEQEWKAQLSPEAYEVLRKRGTERPGTGKYLHHKADGTYVCAGCGAELFKADEK